MFIPDPIHWTLSFQQEKESPQEQHTAGGNLQLQKKYLQETEALDRAKPTSSLSGEWRKRVKHQLA